MCYNGTFRFKKLDDSFWNGETFRFADYKCVFLLLSFYIMFLCYVNVSWRSYRASALYDCWAVSFVLVRALSVCFCLLNFYS